MKKLSIAERKDLRLVAAYNEVDALHYLKQDIEEEWPGLTSFKQWQVAELRDYPPPDVQKLVMELEKSGVPLMNGPRLFAVTAHFEVFVYVDFQPGSPNGGDDRSSKVASPGEVSGEGSTQPQFGGPPTEA